MRVTPLLVYAWCRFLPFFSLPYPRTNITLPCHLTRIKGVFIIQTFCSSIPWFARRTSTRYRMRGTDGWSWVGYSPFVVGYCSLPTIPDLFAFLPFFGFEPLITACTRHARAFHIHYFYYKHFGWMPHARPTRFTGRLRRTAAYAAPTVFVDISCPSAFSRTVCY